MKVSLHRLARLAVITTAATVVLLAAVFTALPLVLSADSLALLTGRDGEVPSLPGPDDAFVITDLEWVDPQRGRRVPARLFWPRVAQGGVPLIVFSHGIGSARDGYGYLGRFWASHGVASLHLQHVGSDRSLWQGNALQLLSRFQQAASDEEAIARVKDFSFALDRLLRSSRGAAIDHARIVAAGHSYGANTALLAAGATVMRAGHALRFGDPRVAAAILISAPPFYGETDLAPILSPIRVPTLHITTAEDIIRIPGFGSGVDDRIKVFNATGSAFKSLAIYKQGSHNVFTERRYFDSLPVATHVKSATQDLSLAFVQQVFSQQDLLNDWEHRHAALMASYVRPGKAHFAPADVVAAAKPVAP